MHSDWCTDAALDEKILAGDVDGDVDGDVVGDVDGHVVGDVGGDVDGDSGHYSRYAVADARHNTGILARS